MSDRSPLPGAADNMPIGIAGEPRAGRPTKSLSPGQRAWIRFTRNRRGYWSLWIFLALLAISLCAELLSNERPLLVKYDGEYFVPLLVDYPETRFGGTFPAPADYLDPFVRDQLAKPGNWAVFAPNRYSYNTLNYFAPSPNPAAPSSSNE